MKTEKKNKKDTDGNVFHCHVRNLMGKVFVMEEEDGCGGVDISSLMPHHHSKEEEEEVVVVVLIYLH